MKNNHKNKFLALLLSAMMVSSFAAFASCSKGGSSDTSDSSSDSESSSTVNDNLLIKNGGFETFNTNKGLNAIGTSVTGWTLSKNTASSGSANTTQAASGIVNLKEDAWYDLTGENADYNVDTLTVDTAKAAWDNLTVKQKLAYYEKWKKENPDGKIAKDLSFYEAFNIESKDIPTVDAFKTHHTDEERAAEGFDDYNVLMLHNQYPKLSENNEDKSTGTAYKYTSTSTVTIPAGASAELSVWVRTMDLRSPQDQNGGQAAVGKGAYISITNSVGGKTLDAFEVKNINTELMSESTLSNGWAQYTFYLKGSSYTNTTFSVVLGLGQGGGSDNFEYVNGYAFFDDVECEIIDNTECDGAIVSANIETDDIVGFDSTKEEKTVDAFQNASDRAFAIDYYGDFLSVSSDVFTNTTARVTESEINGVKYDSLKESEGGRPYMNLSNGGFSKEGDATKVFANFDAIKTEAQSRGGNENALQEVYDEYFKDGTFGKDQSVLLLLSAHGVAYTTDTTHAFQFNSNSKYLAISLFVKTSDLNGFTGAGVTVTDGANKDNKISVSSIDTTNATKVKIGDNEDYYDGWQQVFFFVENASDDANATFSLSFSFGPTAIDGTTVGSYHHGFAAFSQVSMYEMSKQEYDSVSESTYSKTFKVEGIQLDGGSGNDGFDSAAATQNAIEKGLANPSSYKGVYADSAYITLEEGADASINKHQNAGLINKDYFTETDGYFGTATGAWLDGFKQIAGAGKTAKQTWNAVVGEEATQPLLIWNGADSESGYSNKPYGYISDLKTISANQYTVVSVRVKVSSGAKAYVYLIDTSEDNFNNALSVGRNLIYWYDNDGNVCSGDPSESTTEIVLRLQKDGLYKVNTKWSGYKKLSAEQKAELDGKAFANLANYAKDNDGNLVVAEGGASHAYNNYWNNEGEDGIAFYAKDGKYYSDRACTVEVTPFTALSDLAPRYDAVNGDNAKQLWQVVEDTDGEWATVSFYIHTGSEAKNYRLEVWSGARDKDANGNWITSAENSYVLFDANPGVSSSAESYFNNLMDAWKDDDSLEKFESVFSYYDSNKYLRYNELLDENNVTNLYSSYKAEEQTEGLAYVRKEDSAKLKYTTLVDFSYHDDTVTASSGDNGSDSDDSSDAKDSDTNVWLLASSLILAGVLLLAVVSLVVRKLIKKYRRLPATPVKAKKVKKAKVKKAKATKKSETLDEDSPYND